MLATQALSPKDALPLRHRTTLDQTYSSVLYSNRYP
jgi:hypothetical protein